ncbi:MAG: LysM peptidoglycan-binding domain-containing protein [Burkholderiales bacterium]|nr:LysM peptidoglycan-binding domain-containing protein [Flavobacterium sp.]
MKKEILFFFVVFLSLAVFGQSKKKDQEVDIISHEVQLGESVRLISKKYLVDPAEIYRLNKFAVEGINTGMVLKIPIPRKEGALMQQQEVEMKPVSEESAPTEKVVEENITPASNVVIKSENVKAYAAKAIDSALTFNHEVVAKETLFSLSRQYAVSVDDIKASNPQLTNGRLKIGQVIKIPTTRALINNVTAVRLSEMQSQDTVNAQTKMETTESKTIRHTVMAKETLFNLSKKYGVPVSEIKQQNAALLQSGLKIGQILSIKKIIDNQQH